jgi:nucleotide-binding universal stress UspA family protein
MKSRRALLVIGLLIAVTVLHYSTAMGAVPWHTVYRELYFIPIVMSGVWFGKRWGLGASVMASLAYLPHMVRLIGFRSEMALGSDSMFWDSLWVNSFQVFLFNVTGLLAGGYGDARRGFRARLRTPILPAESGRDVLLFLDETPASLMAARYVAEVFSVHRDQRITLLWVSPRKGEEFFPDPEAVKEAEEVQIDREKESLNQARQVLLDAGILPDSLQVKSFRVETRSRISDRILQELEEGDYHTIVLGKHRLSKSEEFLFGSKAIRLVREAGVNVIAAKAPLEPTPGVPPK